MNPSNLPVTRSLSPSFRLSSITALLMAVASLAGLLFPSIIYPTHDLRNSFIATDVVNLFIVLPVLLGSMALARREKLIGLLFLPGALFIVTYHYLAYAIAAPFIWQSAAYLLIAALSVYALYKLVSNIDAEAVQDKLKNKTPERFAGGVLAGFGILFFFWRGALAAQALFGNAILSKPEFATAIADVFLSPIWIIVGILLWRKQAFGYVAGAGLLFQLSMLFIGLFVYFALQPIIAGIPFPMDDFVAVFTMALVCFIPFGLFVRGILSAR